VPTGSGTDALCAFSIDRGGIADLLNKMIITQGDFSRINML